MVGLKFVIRYSDFGLSRNLSVLKKEDLTEYVVTRFYRAPEIMLSSHSYSNSVDTWSIGCTLGEIITGKVIFPGENYIEQVLGLLPFRLKHHDCVSFLIALVLSSVPCLLTTDPVGKNLQ